MKEGKKSLVTWPVEPSIEKISINHMQLIKGWLATLSETLESNVIFLYPKNKAGNPDWNDLEYVQLFFDDANPSAFALFTPESPCDKIRRKSERCNECTKQDRLAAKKTYMQYVDADTVCVDIIDELEFIPFNTGTDDVDAFRYQCRYIVDFTEIIIPIAINVEYRKNDSNDTLCYSKEKHILGVLISGQFLDVPDDVDVKQFINNPDNIHIKNRLKEKGVNVKRLKRTPLPTDVKFKNFIAQVRKFCGSLNELYNRCISRVTVEMFHLSDELQAEASKALNLSISPTHEVFLRLKQQLAEKLYDVTLSLLRNAKFTSIDVFSPCEDTNIYKNTGRLDAFRIKNSSSEDYEKRESHLTNEILARQAKYIVENWKNIFNTSPDDVLSMTKYLSINDLSGDKNDLLCEGYMSSPENKNIEGWNYAILASKSPHELGAPIVFIIRDDSERICSNKVLEDIFKTVITIFWMRWNQICAEYFKFVNDLMIRFNNHEVRQIVGGGRSLTALMEDSLERFKNVSVFRNNIMKLPKQSYYKSLDSFIKNMSFFESDVNKLDDNLTRRKHLDEQLSLIINLTASAFEKEPNMVAFLPYDTVLFPLYEIYKKIAESEALGQKLLVLVNPQISYDDKKRPIMYADKERFYQMCGNLLRNAVKYSHWHSRISVDCVLSRREKDGKTVYRFEVINYGNPEFLVASDGYDLFDLHIRSSLAEQVEKTGIGFGLYLTREFAREMDGEVGYEKPQQISNFHIPLLTQYKHFKSELPESKCEEYRVALEQLSAAELDTVLKEDGRMKILRDAKQCSYEYFIAHINEPTARICFFIELPHFSRKQIWERKMYNA